jgi:putative ABC transport system substrate-binding protein
VGVLLANVFSQEEFRRQLSALGYREGTNVQIDWRIAEGYERVQSLAEELARTKPDLIVSGGDAATRAAIQATKSIPVVFGSGDPIVGGYAKSFSHPGTNATGVYVPNSEIEAKRVELLLELSPRPRRIAYLRNPANPLSVRTTQFVEESARRQRIHVAIIDVQRTAELASVLKTLSRKNTDAVLVTTDTLLSSKSAQIVQALRAARIPAMYPWREYVDAGGLMYYGVSRAELWRQISSYVDRILKGAQPSDLPIEEISKFEFVVNLREANLLQIRLPESLLARADETIR